METIKIFVSYSHSNEDWITSEGKFKLIPWIDRQLGGRVEVWTDHALKQQIGEEYTKLIKDKILNADIAILLISQDFVSSQYITDIELPLIRQCYMVGTLKIVPLLLTNLTQKGKDKISWIFDLQTYPNDTKPLITFFNQDAEWEKIKVEILEGIENKIDSIEQKQKVANGSQPFTKEVPQINNNRQETKPKEQSAVEPPIKVAAPVNTAPSGDDKSTSKSKALLYSIIGGIVVIIGVVVFLFIGKSSKTTDISKTTDTTISQSQVAEHPVESISQAGDGNTAIAKTTSTGTSVSNKNQTNAEKPVVASNPAGQSTTKTENKTNSETQASAAKPVAESHVDPENLITMGNSYDDKGDYDNAIASYKKAISVDPKNAKAYNCMGITYFNKNDYENAIASYQKSLSIDPNNAKVYNNMGNAYGKKRDIAKQIDCYKSAAKLGHKKAQDWLKAHNENW